MTIFFVVLTVVVVVVIALVSIGRVTFSLAAQPPPTFFDLDEAVGFVADRLPDEITAQLSYDELRQLLDWHIDYLLNAGVASTRAGELIVLSAEGRAPVIAADDEGLAFVLGKVAEGELEINDLTIVEVLEAESAYLAAIGALGTRVASPVDSAGPPLGSAGPPGDPTLN